jgi:broad specificity phosphatase PhoE
VKRGDRALDPTAARTTPRTLVVLARHGETALNVERRFRGRSDPPLTEHGQAQAETLAEALESLKPSAVYASPRRRAQRTAAPLAQRLGVTVATDPGLDDLDYGAWTGLTDAEVARRWPAEHALWHHAPEALVLPDGERPREAAARIWNALSEIAARHAGQVVVAVTHDQPIRLALCRALDAPLVALHRLRIDVAAHAGLERHEGGWIVAWSNSVRR